MYLLKLCFIMRYAGMRLITQAAVPRLRLRIVMPPGLEQKLCPQLQIGPPGAPEGPRAEN